MANQKIFGASANPRVATYWAGMVWQWADSVYSLCLIPDTTPSSYKTEYIGQDSYKNSLYIQDGKNSSYLNIQ